MSIIIEAFEELQKHGFTKSQVDFSKNWLSKSPRYYSMMKATGKEPSVDVLARLACKLKQRKDLYEGPYVHKMPQITNWLNPLTQKVWTEFYQQSLNL